MWFDDDQTHHHGASTSTSVAFVQAMKSLEQRNKGYLVWPTTQDDFVNASHVWNQCYREQPSAVVVQVAHEHDVQVVVPFLAEIQHNCSIPFRIRSGEGGISKLGGRQFHTVSSCRWIICGNCPFVKATATATIQPLLRQVLPCETATFYNTFSSNEDTQVLLVLVPTWPWEDIGGQGGLTRLYGLAIDTLRSVRIVLATPADHAVLFWALRGAGQQNFGVVTQLEYTYYPTQDDAFIVAAGEVPVHLVPHFLSSLGRDEPP